MDVTVEGFGLLEEEIKDLLLASEFYADILMDRRMHRKLFCEIEVFPHFTFMGACVCENRDKPEHFTIQLKSEASFGEFLHPMLRVLAHEMVHLKQYARKELTPEFYEADPVTGERRMPKFWHGREWSPKANEDIYLDAPYEIEAFGREEGLYLRYLMRES